MKKNTHHQFRRSLYSLVFIIFIISSITFFGALIIFTPKKVNAYAMLPRGFLTSSTTWTLDRSPYNIDYPINIMSGSTLNIEPGVVINLSPGVIITVYASSSINAKGTPDAPVVINGSGWKMQLLASSTAHFENTDFNGENYLLSIDDGASTFIGSSTIHIKSDGTFSGISVSNGGEIKIASSTILKSGPDYALSIYKGSAVIEDSYFQGVDGANNSNGVLDRAGNVQIVHTSFTDFKSAVEDYLQDGDILFVSSSTFSHNSEYAILNHSTTTVDAKNNYWGDDTGPFRQSDHPNGKGDNVSEAVDVDPWLDQDGKVHGSGCCSSVLFIPGMEGSRLYQKGLTENQLWEPNRNADVDKLAMATDGKSINDIYTRDIIKDTNITGPYKSMHIYDGFSTYLDTLVASGKMTEWQSLPYDWRLSPESIVNDGVRISNGNLDSVSTTSPLASILYLAKKSKTKKVTIVAHSNGGLVAKKLVDEVYKLGKSDLVDKIIFVGVPERGTPMSIGALMYGDGQTILGGMILSADTAKNFAKNSPTAYNLLPSKDYFSVAQEPLISFDPKVGQVTDYIKKYGMSISSKEIMDTFLGANSANKKLIDNSNNFHFVVDKWVPPEEIKLERIAGVGVPTVRGVSYSTEESCLLGINIFCGNQHLVHGPMITNWGDSTVTYLSVPEHERSYFIDLASYNIAQKKDYSHQDILNAPVTQSLLTDIFSSDSNKKNSEQTNTQIPNVTYGYAPTTTPQFVLYSVHSPADIMVLDVDNNMTGVVTSTTTPSLITQQIPNSTYLESDGVKYVAIAGPANSRKNKIKIEGTGLGEFTFMIEEKDGDKVVSSSTFADIPVTPLTEAFVYFSSSTSADVMAIDIDGDGNNDEIISPDSLESPQIYISLITKTVLAFDCATSSKDRLIKKLQKIEHQLTSKTNKKAVSTIKAWSKDLEKSIEKEYSTSSNSNKKYSSQRDGAKHTSGVHRLTVDQSAIMVNMIEHLLDILSAQL